MYIVARDLLFCDVLQELFIRGRCVFIRAMRLTDSQAAAQIALYVSSLSSFETRSCDYSLGIFSRYAYSLRTLSIIIRTLTSGVLRKMRVVFR